MAGMTESATASATYTITGAGVTTLQNGIPLGSRSGSQGGLAYYKITVPSGQAKLTINTSGGSGDCDLYVKRGATPTISSYDYFPNADGNNENVSVDNPVTGDWFIMLRGYSAYSGVTLMAKYDSVAPMFVGILGGDQYTLDDDPNYTPPDPFPFVDSEIGNYLSGLGQLDSQNLTDLRLVAGNNDAGGLFALAFFNTGKANSRSVISGPGNSDIAKAEIDSFVNSHAGAKLFVAGHSVGGGDVQNLLWKLKTLGINVELSGHIDSIELGDDSTIPSNTKRAMGFYQDDHIISVLGVNFPGERNLSAENALKTTVSNTDIDQPLLPFDPTTDGNNYHRNMDNDERVWGVLLDYIKSRLP